MARTTPAQITEPTVLVVYRQPHPRLPRARPPDAELFMRTVFFLC